MKKEMPLPLIKAWKGSVLVSVAEGFESGFLIKRLRKYCSESANSKDRTMYQLHYIFPAEFIDVFVTSHF